MNDNLTAYEDVIRDFLLGAVADGAELPVVSLSGEPTWTCVLGGAPAVELARRVLAMGGEGNVFVLHRDRTVLLGVVPDCTAVPSDGIDFTDAIRPHTALTVSEVIDGIPNGVVGGIRAGGHQLWFRQFSPDLRRRTGPLG